MIKKELKKLSPTQFNMLCFIVDFIKLNQYQPDYNQIALNQGVSITAISKRVKTLIKYGWVEVQPAQARSLIINPVAFSADFGKWVKK